MSYLPEHHLNARKRYPHGLGSVSAPGQADELLHHAQQGNRIEARQQRPGVAKTILSKLGRRPRAS